MNYLKELALFYNRIDSQDLPANAILLWYTLMGISNSLYWKENVPITLSQIESKSKLSKPTIWRMRKLLVEKGLLRYNSNAGRNCGTYKLLSLEQSLSFQSESISETQNDFAFQSESITENIHKHKTYITNKENIKESFFEKMEVRAKALPYLPSTPEKKEKVAPKRKKNSSPPWDESGWIQSLESPWVELMQTWLEYKQSRKEKYKSEMSAVKCLEQLKKLSAGDPKVAQDVVDQSIANNWAGLFELKRQPYYARGGSTPATGQYPGQIKQPETEEARQRILDKFKPKVRTKL